MADKEATVYIIDQGKSMGDTHNSRTEDDLSYGLRYIWDKITTTMEANRKTWAIGILGLRTDATKHTLSDDENYQNISIQQHLTGPYTMPHLKAAQEMVKVSHTEVGDAISAIVVATMMINEFTKKLKYRRKIVLLTNGRGWMDDDDIDSISNKLNEDNISLTVLGLDFDDLEYGFKEEDKDATKADNEQLLRSLCDKCIDGTFANVAEAIEEMHIPRLKEKRPYATYKGSLCLGDPKKYGEDRAMKIEVERYFKIKKAAPPGASHYVEKVNVSNGEADFDGDTEMGGVPNEDGLTSVKSKVTYKINDESALGGKRDIERDQLAKGYSYGRTAVAISASEENITKLETEKDFTILGFVPEEGYKKFLGIGESCLTIATQTNDKDKMALSSLVRAMAENESYAVARFVAKEYKDPRLLLLAPIIEPSYEGLIDVELPFQEDIRSYKFPPLDHVITYSGAILSKHRNIPTDDLIKSMDAYVDSMDLSEFGQDEDGNPTEYMSIEESFRPELHRINQAIRERAANPNAPVPPVPEILKKFSKPPPELVSTSQIYLDKLIEAADVKKVPDKVQGRDRKFGKDKKYPKSGLDVDALLANRRTPGRTIDPNNSIPEFKQALNEANTEGGISVVVSQFTPIIKDLITSSMGDLNHDRVIENIKVLRDNMISYEEPGLYNKFMWEVKKGLFTEDGEQGYLGGDKELFWKIRGEKMGLIGDLGGEEVVSGEEVARFNAAGTVDMVVR